MNNDNDKITFVSRVWRSDSTRRGLAAAAAGVLIALVSEAIWPSA